VGEVRVVHTADLGTACLHETRALLDLAFGGDFTDDDWDHSLGGMHVQVRDGATLVGQASVVLRRLIHGGRALRTGYVEAVAVHPEHRRRGHGGVLLDEVDRVVRGGYQLGALSASDMAAALYVERGWQRWPGQCWALTPDGLHRVTAAEHSVHVLPVSVELDLGGRLTCDYREGDAW
jgi:aminoglycoside 2'-N-acetyltransferase I